MQLDCLALQVQWLLELGQVEEAMRLADKAEAFSKNSTVGAVRLQQRAAIDAVHVWLLSGDVAAARHQFDVTCASWLTAPAAGVERTRCADLLASLDIAEGHYEVAIQSLEGGLDLPRSARDRTIVLLTYGEALLAEDRIESAREQFSRAEQSSAAQHNASPLRGSVAAWRGLVNARAGDVTGAHRDLNAALNIVLANPSNGPRLHRPLTLLKDALGVPL